MSSQWLSDYQAQCYLGLTWNLFTKLVDEGKIPRYVIKGVKGEQKLWYKQEDLDKLFIPYEEDQN